MDRIHPGLNRRRNPLEFVHGRPRVLCMVLSYRIISECGANRYRGIERRNDVLDHFAVYAIHLHVHDDGCCGYQRRSYRRTDFAVDVFVVFGVLRVCSPSPPTFSPFSKASNANKWNEVSSSPPAPSPASGSSCTASPHSHTWSAPSYPSA